MKIVLSVLSLLSSVSAESTWPSEWGNVKRNLRVGRLRRDLSEMSLSMSMPEELLPGLSMSMPEIEDVEFEQFETEFGSSISTSMSLPDASEEKEETFQEFEIIAETGVSISMSMATTEDVLDFEQFGVNFDASMSMSIREEAEFDLFEDGFEHSLSMSMPSTDIEFEQFEIPLVSLSMSVPTEEAFGQFEDDFELSVSMSMPVLPGPVLEQFGNGFGASEPEKTTNDDFFFMPIFDDQSDLVVPERNDELDEDLPSISMSMEEDLAQWSVEGDFDFLEVDELSLSVSMSMV